MKLHEINSQDNWGYDTNAVVAQFKSFADDYRKAAKGPMNDLEPEDAESMREMYLADADDFDKIAMLIRDGDPHAAIAEIDSLDTQVRDMVYREKELQDFLEK